MKKALTLILSLVMLIACAALFTGCGAKVVGIEADVTAVKLDYVKGEALNLDGLKVYACDEKSERKLLDADKYTLTANNKAIASGEVLTKNITINVTYLEDETLNTSFKVKVHNDVKSAAIKTQPTKLSYTAGEPFDPTGMVVTLTYENGETKDVTEGFSYKTEGLTPADANLEVEVSGQKVIVELTIVNGIFIEAETGDIVSTTVDINSDSAEATGGLYVGDLKSGDTVTFSFSADKAGKAEIIFRLASQYLKEDSSWTPILMGDCQLNKIMTVSVNGVLQNIDDSIILPGGGESGGEPNADLWFAWRDVVFGDADLVAGRNTVTITFIPHDYVDCSQASFNGVFTANVDSMKVITSDIVIEGYSMNFTDASFAAPTHVLELRDGKPVLVIGGGTYAYTSTGYTAEEAENYVAMELQKYFHYDLQSDPNEGGDSSWATHFTNTHKINLLGDNKFEVVLDLSAAGPDAYIVHFAPVIDDPGDGAYDYKPDVDVFELNLEVGAIKYTVVYDKATFFGCVGIKVVNDTLPVFNLASVSLVEENGAVYYVVTCNYKNYDEVMLCAYRIDLENDKVDYAAGNIQTKAENGVLTIKVNVTNFAEGRYWPHMFKADGTTIDGGNGDVKVEAEGEITLGGKIYSIVMEWSMPSLQVSAA